MSAIKISAEYSENELPICTSKFWGNPDLPKTFTFPTYKDEEGDESHYDFVCQIKCSELIPYDTENRLPHKGMLYFFAQVGYYLGDIYFCEPMPSSWWPSNGVKVLYYPHEDWENFEQVILLDDEDEEIALREQKITFKTASSISDSFNDGHQLLGFPSYIADEIDSSKYALLLQVDSCDLEDGITLNFMDWGMLYFLIPVTDLTKPSFKNVRGYLASS